MIDKTKQYKTRDGREVRIYATDGFPEFPVHGAIYVDGWFNISWRYDGTYGNSEGHINDLIEVKPRIKRTVWLNIYKEHTTSHPTRECAKLAEHSSCLACKEVPIDMEHGEGL